jgi:hypothetical protein
MYTGDLWLDFESDEEEAHYSAQISRCILREDELVFEFSGADEGHIFTGSCTLRKNDDSYTGSGNFAYDGQDTVPSTVSLRLEKDGTEIRLHGIWQDQGDTESYQLEAELREI